MANNVPTRRTSEYDLNAFNAMLKQQPWYQQYMQSIGMWDRPARLSRGQQSQLEQLAARNGFRIPGGMHIDNAGNLNQKNRLVRNVGIGVGTGLAAAGTLGLAGIGPLAGGALGGGSGLPVLASTPIGTGMGFGPASLAGTSAIPGAAAAVPTAADLLASIGVPELPSRTIGSGMGRDPSIGLGNRTFDFPPGGGNGDSDNGRSGGDSDLKKKAINAAFAALAGLAPKLFGNDNKPTPEEQFQQERVNRLLAQQERRTAYQDPLFAAITRMAYGLQPRMGTNGQPYPYNSLSDVKVPGF